jgi:hypothetical protein
MLRIYHHYIITILAVNTKYLQQQDLVVLHLLLRVLSCLVIILCLYSLSISLLGL